MDEYAAAAADLMQRWVDAGYMAVERDADGTETYRLTASGKRYAEAVPHLAVLSDPKLAGALDGFWLEARKTGDGVRVFHRCGWGLDMVNGAYLPDVINGPVADHRRDGCSP